jgi:hypothetical protein
VKEKRQRTQIVKIAERVEMLQMISSCSEVKIETSTRIQERPEMILLGMAETSITKE